MPQTSRLNLRIDDEFKERLERLKSRLDAGTYSEVIRRSMVFAEEMIEAVDEGKLIVVKDGNETEIKLF